jgi:hypothetical protein
LTKLTRCPRRRTRRATTQEIGRSLADKNRLDTGTNGVSTKLIFSLVVNALAIGSSLKHMKSW